MASPQTTGLPPRLPRVGSVLSLQLWDLGKAAWAAGAFETARRCLDLAGADWDLFSLLTACGGPATKAVLQDMAGQKSNYNGALIAACTAVHDAMEKAQGEAGAGGAGAVRGRATTTSRRVRAATGKGGGMAGAAPLMGPSLATRRQDLTRHTDPSLQLPTWAPPAPAKGKGAGRRGGVAAAGSAGGGGGVEHMERLAMPSPLPPFPALEVVPPVAPGEGIEGASPLPGLALGTIEAWVGSRVPR